MKEIVKAWSLHVFILLTNAIPANFHIQTCNDPITYRHFDVIEYNITDWKKQKMEKKENVMHKDDNYQLQIQRGFSLKRVSPICADGSIT